MSEFGSPSRVRLRLRRGGSLIEAGSPIWGFESDIRACSAAAAVWGPESTAALHSRILLSTNARTHASVRTRAQNAYACTRGTHTCACACARMHAHACAHACARTRTAYEHARARTRTHTCARSHVHAHARTHARTFSYASKHGANESQPTHSRRAHARARGTHTHAPTHACTRHARTHSRSRSRWRPPGGGGAIPPLPVPSTRPACPRNNRSDLKAGIAAAACPCRWLSLR